MCIPSPESKRIPPRRNSSLVILLLAILSSDLWAAPEVLLQGSELQNLITEAKKTGAKQITIPPGTYRLSEAWRIGNLKDVEINARDVTLVMTQPKEVLFIEKCENLALKGLTIDYDPLPFTQGTITAIPDDKTVEFQIHEGYPALQADMLPANVARHFFDRKTRLWKEETNDFSTPKLEILGERKGRATFHREQTAVKAGDYICFDRRMLGQGSGVAIRSCTGTILIEDVTVHASPALAFVGRLCEGKVVFRRVKIERGPRPAGATEDRLLSSNADGVNFAFCRTGPTLEDCDFGFMADDSVNVHGACLPVVRVVAPDEVLLGKPGDVHSFYEPLQTGDTVEVLAASTFEQVGKTTLQSVEPVQAKGDVKPEEIGKFFGDYKDFKKPFTLYRLKLAKGVDFIQPGQWITFPDTSCPGYLISNSFFHDNRGRGLRMMGSNGRIEGNRFERIGTAAIQIGPEFRQWRESGWVENVTITKNTIRNIGFSTNFTYEGCYTPGAISICAATDGRTPPIWQGNKNITIEDNEIEGCPVSAIHAYAVNRLIIRQNTIRKVNQAKGHATGRDFLLTAQHPIELDGVSDPIVQDNKISD